jgi:AcrR family transcriptional regulator
LPLTTSLPADLNRVMVGRIELVTPAQRNNLLELAHYPTNVISREAGQLAQDFFGPMSLAATNNLAADRAMQRVNQEFEQVGTGLKPLSAFVSIPKTYRTYLDLGRFRNALILDEAKRQPTEGLAQLIANYRLQAYQPPDPTGK